MIAVEARTFYVVDEYDLIHGDYSVFAMIDIILQNSILIAHKQFLVEEIVVDVGWVLQTEHEWSPTSIICRKTSVGSSIGHLALRDM